MRAIVFLGIAVLFTLAFADHKQCHPKGHKGSHYRRGKDPSNTQYPKNDDNLAWKQITSYNTKFAFNLYRRVALEHPSENIFFSPFSISTALALLCLGAKDHTRSQIIEGLGFDNNEISEQQIHEGFRQLLVLLSDVDNEMQLSGGNALFISEEHKILQKFLDEAKKFYQSEAFPTDFTDTDAAKYRINSYVETNTHGKIVKLLESLDENTVLVIINYIYFKGKWEDPFDARWTKEGEFYVNEKTILRVPYMRKAQRYKVAFKDDATVVSLPYKGDTEAIFVLPKEGKLSKVEQNMNERSILNWKKSMKKEYLSLSVPKFSISATIDLKATLPKMGLQEVFSNYPNLSGITTNIRINKAVHKAVLSVYEEGSEAAAATGVEITVNSSQKSVILDRPFIISLYHNPTKTVLFTGRVLIPQK